MNKEEFKGIILREKETSLRMSRVPRATKKAFVELAEADFEGDFGMCLKWCYNQSLEYKKVKDILLDKCIFKKVMEVIKNQNKGM